MLLMSRNHHPSPGTFNSWVYSPVTSTAQAGETTCSFPASHHSQRGEVTKPPAQIPELESHSRAMEMRSKLGGFLDLSLNWL